MQDRKRETADALQNVGGDSSRKRRAITHTFIAELVVREEADVKKISRELYNMQKSKSRSKGVSMA